MGACGPTAPQRKSCPSPVQSPKAVLTWLLKGDQFGQPFTRLASSLAGLPFGRGGGLCLGAGRNGGGRSGGGDVVGPHPPCGGGGGE